MRAIRDRETGGLHFPQQEHLYYRGQLNAGRDSRKRGCRGGILGGLQARQLSDILCAKAEVRLQCGEKRCGSRRIANNTYTSRGSLRAKKGDVHVAAIVQEVGMSMSLSSPVDIFPYGALASLANGNGPEAQAATERLVELFQPLIRDTVRKYTAPYPWLSPEQRADVWQAAQLGFIEALKRFDPSRGSSLGGYARKFILGEVRKIVADEDEHRQCAEPLANYVCAEDIVFEVTIEDEGLGRIEESEIVEAVRMFVFLLPDSHRYLVESLYWEGCSQAEVARRLGVSRAAVNKTLGKILRHGHHVLARFNPAHSMF
jgi:RNA polymerase sigma factor (sigma-70 family)